MKTDDKTLIAALEILARDIQSDDGVANACISEAAQRLRDLTEWQKIETAPKDGTEVILSLWSGSYDTPKTSFCWAINGYYKDGFWRSKDPMVGRLQDPSHWQQILPPKGDKNDQPQPKI